MRQFSFSHDANFDEQEEKNRLFFINNRSQTENSIMQRFQSSILRVPKLEGIYAPFPAIQSQFKVPYVNDVITAQQKTILFTPAPPIIRNQSQKAIWRIVKKFANKYEYLWVLITKMDDEKLNQIFTDIFKQQKLSNVNQNLENMIAPQDFQRVKMFTKQGLDVKIMMDYYSYQNYVSKDIKNLQKINRVLQIFVQSQKVSKRGVMGTKKIKNVLNLVQFLENQVKPDIEKCRKDKPYFNFIHSNSTPELFSRRSIIKNCISSKYQSQLQENQKNFLILLRKYNDDQRDMNIKALGKLNLEQTQMVTKINEINQRHRKLEQTNAKFESTFKKILTIWYPIQKQPEEARKQIYDWIITQYSIQSAIYPVVNNTIRFTNSTEKVRPLSTFIKYLFDAIRYYFTTRFRAVNYNVVYRGSRISLVQQRSFKQGRYMWNLGFMSTSRSQKVANGFLASYRNVQTQQKILIRIQLPKLTNSIEYLWNQQGFYSLDYIPDIANYIIKDEQQVLFNPLNVFQIIKWESDNRLLVLKYSPHLQILEKKKHGIKINIQQQQLLRSISKLQDGSYDKGQQLLEQGDPGGAIKYYEQSNESGSNLSFSQKSNYIQGLREVCNLQKMEIMIKDSLQEEKNAEKQLLSTQSTLTGASIVDKLADSVQSLTLFEQTSNFQIADERAQFAKNTSSKISQKFKITQQTLLLQTKTYIQLSKIKFGISETFQSIKQGIRSLKIIDELANINLTFRLWQIGKDLRQIKNMVIKEDMKCLKRILSDQQFFNLDIQQEKKKALSKIQNVRKWNIQSQGSRSINNSQIIRGSTSTKNDHKTAERILEDYFKSRDRRTQAQKLQQMFILAFWQSDRIKIERQTTEIEQIQSRQKLKLCQQKLFEVKNDYKDLFQHQVEAYQVLYRNIYKTSINVQHCLESYHRNVFRRYRQFIQIQCKYEGESVQKAKVLWKYAQILFQYGQIIERPKMNDKSHQTQSQREGDQLIKGSEAVINRIQVKESRITGNKQTYTYQKSQIRRAITRYFKKKAIDKDEARKLSVVKNQSQYSHSSILSTSSSQQKNLSFTQIIKALNENKQLIQSDSSIDKPMYKIKNSIQKIEVMNESSHILVANQSYIERLKQCRVEFDDVLSTIQKYKEKQLMQRNINMSHLYLLMAENQFRLGLIMSAKNFLKQSDQCIKKALKIQTKEDTKKLRRLNRQKLILGSNTHIGCLRLQSHIVAFYGTAQEQKSLIETLRAKKQTMFSIMHEPLNQADINQSIGIISVNLILKYRELKFQDAQKHLTAAIKIREKLLGPFNKLNARNYTFIIQLVSIPEIFQKHYPQIEQYYKIASQIYNRMDFSCDSMLIIFRMQLQSTFLMFSYRQNQASAKILQSLNQLHQCHNMHLSLQAAQELYRCSFFLSQQALHQKQGLKWLKLTYKYTSNLQKMVTKTYSLQDGDLRKYHLTKLKLKILQKITQLQIKSKGTQLDKYWHKYKQMKQKLQQLKNLKGMLSEVSSNK